MAKETKVPQWVQDFVARYEGSSAHWKPGMRVKHPNGYEVEIVEGQYWGTHGLSNFWSWLPINEDGTYGELESGYGW